MGAPEHAYPTTLKSGNSTGICRIIHLKSISSEPGLQNAHKSHLEPVLLEKHPFSSGEFCFSTQGHAESNVPSYSCFNILNYGWITNVSPLH